ncbi:Ig-like domain-containing protein [Flavobacterium sp.]|uniref:Ig-like domain-containing protein n=1 Tax=Flavobacterium sp. TaxID=239 RepID=UPI002601B790|nr:Ig-like domain-containing protein [Flavobacterium sp.]
MKKILILFLVLIFANPILGQNLPNDCVNALVVCGNGTFSSNASGSGNVQEVAGCSSSEHNSLWIKINIVQSGTLGFDLIPNDPDINVDYDFWVYGPNKTCGSLGSPIRCCTTNPAAANLLTNHTGLNDIITATTAGNGANGNGYVYRLNVVAGQSYYIAVDRPHGDGGFQIQWNGTATLNGGAFPTPPTANQIPDLKRCSNVNVGIFDLNPVKSQINSDLTTNTINFYSTLANAVDAVSPLPTILTSGTQKIYARVTHGVSGCYTITDFNLVVSPVPSANIFISDTAVCSGENVTVNFTGTPGATVEYTINNGPIQSFLFDGTGTYQLVQAVNVNTTYALFDVKVLDGNNTTVCHQSENDTVSVTVSSVSAPTLTTNSPICEGDTAVLNFSGLANAVITYSIDGGSASTVTLDASGQKQVNLTNFPVGSHQINVSNIADSNAPNCSQSLNINETIVVNAKITAAILVTPNVCEGSTSSQIVFTGVGGTAPYEFVYTINGGPIQSITTTAGDSVSITIPTNVPGIFTYQLVSVASTLAPSCVFSQTGAGTVTVNALPSVSGTLSLCQGTTTQLTGSGSPATVTPWTSDNTAVATVSNSGLVTGVSAGTAVITYVGANGCGKSVTVTIKQTPIISGNFSTCINSTSQLTVSEIPATSSWSSSNTAVATVSASGLVSALSQGTSTITYTSANTCFATTLFTVYTAPTITGSIVICSNETTQLTGSGTPATTNPWVSNNTAVATINGNGLVSGVSAGSTLITYSDSNGCSNIITVTVNALPTISGTLLACQGMTTQLTGSGTPAVTNPWTSSNTTVATINATGLVTGVATGTTTITYTNNSGCKSTAIVTINALPTIGGTLTVCTGSTTQLTGSGTPADTNPWISSNTAIATVSATGLVTGVSVGTTTITYTNANGCSITATVTVSLTPTASISNLGASTLCSGSAVNIQISGASGTTVNYSVNSNSISAVIPVTGIINITSAITSTTIFTLINVVNGSCTNTIGQSVTVNVTQPPLATISYNGPYCVTESTPQSINFSGTSGGYYTVNPSTGLSINSATGAILPSGSTPGTYQVTYNVAASGGCPLYTSSSATVVILNGPAATISYGALPFCVSDTTPVNVIQTGTTGGTYSAIPSGLSIDSTSGIITPNMSAPGIYTVYYKIAGSGSCPELIKEATVTILDTPKPIVNPGVLCIDVATNLPFTTTTLGSGLDPTGLTFQWFFNGIQVGSSSTYEASEIGSYTLIVTNSANCSTTVVTSVTSSYPALENDVTYTVSNYFEDNQVITITVNGTGSYLYSLDGGPFQESNAFTNVSSGEHSVTIHDSEGCTDVTIDEIITIGYPNFFTPNGDGYHDTWNVWSLNNQTSASIHIFDRLGKLIKQIRPSDSGWDGTFNGAELPSTDYWFSIEYKEKQVDKVFKSHFALKR